jgi:hypothetical protein
VRAAGPRLAALLAGIGLLAAPRAARAQDEPGATAAGAAADAVQGFESVLPPDTFAFFGSGNVDAALRNLGASAYGAWWRDAANAPLREALADGVSALGDEATAEIGVDPLALPAMAHGRLAFAVAGDLAAEIRAGDPGGLALILLADVGADREACDAIVATLEDELAADDRTARKLEDIDGTEVTVLEEVRPAGKPRTRFRVAFHDDTLVVLAEFLPTERDLMAFILGRLAGEPAASLADSPRFRDSLAAQPGDVQGWFDAGAMLAGVRVAVEKQGEAKPDEPVSGDEQDDEAGESELMQRLGVFDIGAISLSMGWSGEGSRMQIRLDWPGDGWIPAVARCLLGPGEAGLISSAPGSAFGATSLHIDFGALFDEVIRIVVQSGKLPPSAAADVLAQTHETLGFDLREDLLEALDGRVSVCVFRVPPEDALPIPSFEVPFNEVVLIGLRDGKEVNSLIEGYVRRTAAHATRQRSVLLGHEVFHIPLLPGFTAHYAILPDVAIVSFSETLLLDALRRQSDPGTSTLGQDSLFRTRVSQLEMPAGLMHYTVASLGLLVAAGAADSARERLVEMLTDETATDASRSFAKRLGDLPEIDPQALSRYFDGGMLTTLTMDERGLLFQSASP